ncbi:MAG: 4-hydroxy-tetrahydrodipicolinate reductase [Actinomycetota bacterium]|nr:4-hydroxy-tetrahydrodipicolinate reductase [Actinomycetota bacterium]
MGRLVSRAVVEDPDMVLVGAISLEHAGEAIGPTVGHPESDVTVSTQLETLLQAETEVAVDFTRPDVVMDNIRWAVDHAMHIVVGTTGIGAAELDTIRSWVDTEADNTNVVVAPNFSIGAAVAQRFAEEAARVFPAVEVIEMHHDQKADAPSGTAVAAAERIAAARAEKYEPAMGERLEGARGADVDGVRVHAIRLPGIVGHHAYVFGSPGQTLTIQHDATDRSAFVPGVLLAIKEVARRPGLTVGVESLLDL